jgi:hypothetical protein
MRKPKRPRDPSQLAKMVVDMTTGELADDNEQSRNRTRKSPRDRGGHARAFKLPAEQRTEIARLAAEARWKRS